MSQASQAWGSAPALARASERSPWLAGFYAAAAWGAAALVTVALPDVAPWGSGRLFAAIVATGAVVLAGLAATVPNTGRLRAFLDHYGPWFIVIGVWFALWEFSTAKTGWLPKPFFSPPNGLLNVYVTEAPRLAWCIGYSLRLWALGFGAGAIVGYSAGVALGWSKRFAYWGMPFLKLIGPVPATACRLQPRRVGSTTAFGRRPPVGDVLAGGEAGLAVIETLFCISCKRILDGAQECAAFKAKDFIRMHASTICKVEFFPPRDPPCRSRQIAHRRQGRRLVGLITGRLCREDRCHDDGDYRCRGRRLSRIPLDQMCWLKAQCRP